MIKYENDCVGACEPCVGCKYKKPQPHFFATVARKRYAEQFTSMREKTFAKCVCLMPYRR